MILENFFSPKSIAVSVVKNEAIDPGYKIIFNLKSGGFTGEIVPLNTEHDDIQGLTCYNDLQDYGEPVDLAVITSERNDVLKSVRDAVNAGTKAILIVTSGFKETGLDGFEIENEIVEACRSGGARLMGPNSIGLINTSINLNASLANDIPPKGGISIFSQSGAICSAMLDMARHYHLGISKVANIGNKADVDESDMILCYGEDKTTSVLLGYIENISAGDRFVKNAETVTTQKPVIILKAGNTSSGRKAAASHTGAIFEEENAYCAAFKRSGVTRADTFDELFDYAAAFSMQPLPHGKRIMIIASAGGPGTVAADAVERAGLEVAEVEYSSHPILLELADTYGHGDSPVTVVGDSAPEVYVETIEAGMKEQAVDAVLLVLATGNLYHPEKIIKEVTRHVASYGKTILISWMGRKKMPADKQEFFNTHIPDYPSPERAVAALKAMYEYYQWKNRPPRLVTRFRVNRRKVDRIIRRHRATNRLFLGDIKTKRILDAYGFHTLPGGLASSAEEAVEIASRIGYPVAVKIVSPDIIHKTDLGGVKLNILDASGVEDAFDLMMLRIRQRHPSARIEGVFIEKMAERGLEVIIGMHREPGFGPMLMFGLGGIFVEVMNDITFYLAPITEDEAVQMLKSTRSYEMLQGKRGKKGVDIHAIAGCLQRISQLTTDFPEIQELDINPLIVGEADREPVVVDARMTLSPLKPEGLNEV